MTTHTKLCNLIYERIVHKGDSGHDFVCLVLSGDGGENFIAILCYKL